MSYNDIPERPEPVEGVKVGKGYELGQGEKLAYVILLIALFLLFVLAVVSKGA